MHSAKEWLMDPINQAAGGSGFLFGVWAGLETLETRYEHKLEAKYGDNWAEASVNVSIHDIIPAKEIIGCVGGIALTMTAAFVAGSQLFSYGSRSLRQRLQARSQGER